MNLKMTKETSNSGQSYWAIVKRQFKKNKVAVWSLRVIYVVFFIGIMADFLANSKPIVCKIEGKTYFPIFKEYLVDWKLGKWPPELLNFDWQNGNYDFKIMPPVPYSETTTDKKNVHYVGPFDEQDVPSLGYKHWLGTDDIGRDVLSGLIHGTRIAMLVGIVSMFFASIIGIFFGALAGYFGDSRLKLSRIAIILSILTLPFAWFYAFSIRSQIISDAFGEGIMLTIMHLLISIILFAIFMSIPILISIPLNKISFLGKKVEVPVDIIVSRIIEVLISIPTLLLIMSIVAVVKKPNVFLIMAIIGLTGWTGIARFIRGELLRVRSLEYIEAAQSLGFSEFRTILRHAIPNSLSPVLISIAFGVAGAILTEASLSYLGIGVEAEVLTWGKLLNMARGAPTAWWLAIFPGFAIFITVTVFNLLGEGLTDAMDPRLKQ